MVDFEFSMEKENKTEPTEKSDLDEFTWITNRKIEKLEGIGDNFNINLTPGENGQSSLNVNFNGQEYSDSIPIDLHFKDEEDIQGFYNCWTKEIDEKNESRIGVALLGIKDARANGWDSIVNKTLSYHEIIFGKDKLPEVRKISRRVDVDAKNLVAVLQEKSLNSPLIYLGVPYIMDSFAYWGRKIFDSHSEKDYSRLITHSFNYHYHLSEKFKELEKERSISTLRTELCRFWTKEAEVMDKEKGNYLYPWKKLEIKYNPPRQTQ